MQNDLIIQTLRWEILRHQYGIFVAESQTFLLAKRPQQRREKEKRMLSQANSEFVLPLCIEFVPLFFCGELVSFKLQYSVISQCNGESVSLEVLLSVYLAYGLS